MSDWQNWIWCAGPQSLFSFPSSLSSTQRLWPRVQSRTLHAEQKETREETGSGLHQLFLRKTKYLQIPSVVSFCSWFFPVGGWVTDDPPIMSLDPSIKSLSSHRNSQKTIRKTIAYCSWAITYFWKSPHYTTSEGKLWFQTLLSLEDPF